MNKLKGLAGGVGVLVLALLLLGFVVLPPLVRPAVERAAKSRDVDLTLDSLYLSPLSGTIGMGGVALANMPGYSGPQLATLAECDINTKLFPLLRGNIDIERISLEQPELYAERLANGDINVTEFLRRLTGKDDAPAEPDTAGDESGAVPPFQVGRVSVEDAVVHWVDRAVMGETVQLSLEDVDVTVRDLYAPMPPDRQDTRFTVTGQLGGAASGTFNANGTGNFVKETVDFTLTAEFTDIDIAALGVYAAAAPVQPSGGTVSGTVDATCRENQLDATAHLQFAGLTLQPNQRSNLAFRAPQAVLSNLGELNPNREMTVRVTGDLANPRFNIFQAVMLAAMKDLVTMPAGALGVAADVGTTVGKAAGEAGKQAAESTKDVVGSVVDRLPFSK